MISKREMQLLANRIDCAIRQLSLVVKEPAEAEGLDHLLQASRFLRQFAAKSHTQKALYGSEEDPGGQLSSLACAESITEPSADNYQSKEGTISDDH